MYSLILSLWIYSAVTVATLVPDIASPLGLENAQQLTLSNPDYVQGVSCDYWTGDGLPGMVATSKDVRQEALQAVTTSTTDFTQGIWGTWAYGIGQNTDVVLSRGDDGTWYGNPGDCRRSCEQCISDTILLGAYITRCSHYSSYYYHCNYRYVLNGTVTW